MTPQEEIRINQRILSRLVDRHIGECATSLVEKLIQLGTDGDRDCPSYDDIQTTRELVKEDQFRYIVETEIDDATEDDDVIYVIKKVISADEDEDEEILRVTKLDYDRLQALHNEEWELDGDDGEIVTMALKEIRATPEILIGEFDEAEMDEDGESIDIFEWWRVDSWFAEKLEEQGAVILDHDYGRWWGRETSGQAISSDGIIERIASNMGILVGQSNSWADDFITKPDKGIRLERAVQLLEHVVRDVDAVNDHNSMGQFYNEMNKNVDDIQIFFRLL